METEQKRERIIRFRVNDDEYNAIAKAAEESGFDSMSDYIRTIAIDRCIFSIDKDELAKLRRLISAISNNINQIAIRVNSTGKIYSDDIAELKEGVRKTWQQQACILSLLHRQEP
ncbi:MAG: MobC family plasmid mobilization relaxosome protein [Ruminococcus sp.]|nr:MobC family plasmid mobilization relaxosome protein [Ruminococcus sp.]